MSDNDERNHLIEQMRQIARDIGADHVSRNEFRRRTKKYSERRIMLLFGSYNALVEAAGLKTVGFPEADTPYYSDNELLQEVVRVLRMPESKMTRIYFEQHANVSPSVCERRFGGWIGTLRMASELLDSKEDQELLKRCREYTDTRVHATPLGTNTNSHAISADAEQEPDVTPLHSPVVQPPVAMETSPNVFGDFMNFRGLQHEPVNEQGVVFLFGMVCKELGYVVESVRSGFPDCEAKRKVGGNPTRWQRVRIEFEYHSRTFRSHGHDPDQCDVIVCWKNNWPECPIEVLELSTAVTRLPS